MRSMSAVLARVHEAGSWFARAQELRLLSVRSSGELRKVAASHLQRLEFHADNRSPWVVLEEPWTAEDDGWQARANRLAEDWERRRQAFAKEGIALPAVVAQGEGGARARPPSGGRAAGPEARLLPFVQAASDVLGAAREPLRGLVLVLAPSSVEQGAALEAELEVLLAVERLAACRWVLVLGDDVAPPRRLLEKLGAAALECDARVDPAAVERDAEALATPDVRAGLAGPRGVKPPRRVDDPAELPPEQRDAELRKAGVDPRYLDEAPQLRARVVGAALAMKRGQGAEAVRLQREARDLADGLGLHPVKVICQIALASYLSGLGHEAEALRELEAAALHAKARALPVQESQAQLALGLLHALGRRRPQATEAYVRAARAAEAGESPLIAIEAWRLAGQLALEGKLPGPATTAFKEAIRVAEGAEPAVARVSSAPEAARALAVLCRRHGLAAQAESLEAQARAMEGEGMAEGSAVPGNAEVAR